MRIIPLFLIAMLVIGGGATPPAQAGSGFYLSSELGINVSKALTFDGDSNDVASHCDAITNPGLSGCNPEDFRYTGQFVPDWFTNFSEGAGIMAGAAVGYSFAERIPDSPLRGFRVELEYFFRESEHNEAGDIGSSGATLDKIQRREFQNGPTETLGSITSHNIFGNVFYDFPTAGSKFTPYIGVGGGVGLTEADWDSNWMRTLDQGALRDGLTSDGRPDLAANDVFVNRLAGASSTANDFLRDTIYGFQLLLGADYALSDTVTLGIKGRYVSFSSFTDTVVWDPLRGHAPFVGPNNTNPVWGHMITDDMEFFGASVNLKYHF